MAATKSTGKKSTAGFSEEERAAMKDRAEELKAERAAARGAKADLEPAVLAKIAEMPEADRAMATRLHEIIRAAAPELAPKLWYGMPAYARAGKVVAFFQPGSKFGARYSTLGFQDSAHLDDGALWPTSFAITELTPETEQRIADLIARA